MKVIALLFTILAVATGFATPPSDDPPVPGRTTYSGGLVGNSGCMMPSAANYDATADVDDGTCVFCNGGLFFTGTGSPLTAMTAPLAEGADTRGGGADCDDCAAGQICSRTPGQQFAHLPFPAVCWDL